MFSYSKCMLSYYSKINYILNINADVHYITIVWKIIRGNYHDVKYHHNINIIYRVIIPRIDAVI